MRSNILSLYKSVAVIALGSSVFSTNLYAEHDHYNAPDAPIGIMGYHLHPEGEWMLSYSFMKMQMEDNLDGTDKVSAPLPGYMISPLNMDMSMHMLGFMYGYSKKVTLMAMLPVINNSMDLMMNMNGNTFTTESSGMGDLKLSMLFESAENWVNNIGLNLPTGSINEKDTTPMSNGVPIQLPYPMQLGSGSYELTLGTAFIKLYGKNNWGNKVDIIVRLNDNDRDYKLGNSIELNSWYSYGATEKGTLTARVKLLKWNNISGEDTTLNSVAVPTANANLRAGTRADLLLGYNYQLTKKTLVGIEVGAPFYQNLDGPQLKTNLTLQLGVQYEF